MKLKPITSCTDGSVPPPPEINLFGRSVITHGWRELEQQSIKEPDERASLPIDIGIEEIELHLDRVAMAIDKSPHGDEYLPMFSWLEHQLERKRRHLSTVKAIGERIKRLRGRTATPS